MPVKTSVILKGLRWYEEYYGNKLKDLISSMPTNSHPANFSQGMVADYNFQFWEFFYLRSAISSGKSIGEAIEYTIQELKEMYRIFNSRTEWQSRRSDCGVDVLRYRGLLLRATTKGLEL